MRVLQVTNTDLPGRRFNGFDLMDSLEGLGVESHMAVLDKLSDNSRVRSLTEGWIDERLRVGVQRLEHEYGMNGLLPPWGAVLSETDEFRAADVVHYHLIHNRMISLLDLPRLCAIKPSVWTFHDSWPLTGHCIQPCGCDGWTTGCTLCPRPELPFPLAAQYSALMWTVKRDVYSRMDVDIVAPTQRIADRLVRSDLGSHFDHVHVIPFSAGALDVPSRLQARDSLGVSADAFVILFRSSTSEFKGLRYLIDALQLRSPEKPTTLLAVDQTGLLSSLSEDYDVRDLGWADDALYSRLLGACDVVVTPYPWAVGFGLMAVEAMAAERTVVCFEETSIAETTFAPDCGVSVEYCNPASLRAALDRLMHHPEERAARGALGKQLALSEYPDGLHAKRMLGLYTSVVERHQKLG